MSFAWNGNLLKRALPKSLFGRTLIIILMPLILVQVVLGYIFFDRHTEAVLKLLSHAVVGEVRMIHELYEQDLPKEHVKQLAQETFNITVTYHPGMQLERVGVHRDRWLYQFLSDGLRSKMQTPYFLKMDSQTIRIDLQKTHGVLRYQFPRKRLYSRTTPLVLIWTTVSALILFIVASIFMRNQVRPIRRLADAAEAFGKGGAVSSFRPEGALEVRKAGHAFLVMQERLNRLIRERTEMLAGVSHDLRTPLARMKLQLAMMPPQEAVESLKEEVNHMQMMLQGFLDFSRGADHEESQRTDLKQLVQEVIYSLNHKNLSISTQFDQRPIILLMKPLLFKRCLTNLLLNCDRYGNRAHVSITRLSKTRVEIVVDDNGPGIETAEMQHIFKPFYRGDAARSLDSPNVGLGLSIARDAVIIHGGRIYLEKSPMGGLRVVITMPC